MRCFLSIFIERFGKYSSDRMNLLTMPSLKDLDICTKLHKNPQELREHFHDEIERFERQFETELKLWQLEHPNKTNHGKIYANFIAKRKIDNQERSFIATIPILYGDDKIVPFDEAIKHMVYYLDIDANFERLFHEKSYLLLDEKNIDDETEYSLAEDYLRYKDEILKHEVINRLINRFKIMNEEDRYVYLRSLTNLCHLKEHEIYAKKGKIGLVNEQMPKGKTCLYHSNYQIGIKNDALNENFDLEKKKRGK